MQTPGVVVTWVWKGPFWLLLLLLLLFVCAWQPGKPYLRGWGWGWGDGEEEGKRVSAAHASFSGRHHSHRPGFSQTEHAAHHRPRIWP